MKLSSFIAVLSIGLVRGLTAEDAVEYNRDIRPILSENCFYCHGFDEKNRKAKLRLDTFPDATADLGGYRAIVPGDAKASELIRRINSEDHDDLMPPPEQEQHLSQGEIALITSWINQGAAYQEHWAWRDLDRPQVPKLESSPSAIDAFLQEGWRKEQAEPVSLATPRERLRRLSFDLRGLPPQRADVIDFERDPSPAAFAGFRDRWMASLPYAEHQAVTWLDLVRWADTSGLVSDEPIASGAYRAWVIRALQDNLPFDQFSIYQLAGDLLPNPTDDQLIASGYNRILNTNCEAGAIEEEQLYKLKGEHVRAFGTVWLGMTTGCAECHDHKFDPFSAKDYYQLAAFFDDLVEAGVYTPGDRREPLHYVHREASNRLHDQALVQQILATKALLAEKPDRGLRDWETGVLPSLKDTESRKDFVWIPAQLPAPRIIEGAFDEVVNGGQLVRETRVQDGEFYRHHAAEFITGFVRGRSQKTNEKEDAWYVDVWLDPDDPPEMVGFQISHGDYGRLGWRTANYETYYWGDDQFAHLAQAQSWNDPDRVKRIGDLPITGGWARLRVRFDQLIPSVPGQAFVAVGMAWFQSSGRVHWGGSGLELRTDKVTALELGETAVRKWWEVPWNRQVYQRRAAFVSDAIRIPARERTDLQSEVVLDAFRENTQPQLMEQLRRLESDLHQLRADAMPVLVSRQSKTPKTTRVVNRGDYADQTGPLAVPSVPEFLKVTRTSVGKQDRLKLANWLFQEARPLVARVFVNRLWHQFFGRGLSETLEDSGMQGDWPSHVELLDWLASEFVDSGWDRQYMIRLLTSSMAYQLSSTPSNDLAFRDPGNRWHARQGRFRFTAEVIRDSSLQVAGLLSMTMTVPQQSFYPYQPAPYWNRSDKVMFGSRHLAWDPSQGAGQYHRSLYTFWKRQNIHPTMLAFDAPTRQECTAKRNITNTPGQALALLNDPIFVEAARVFAERLCGESISGDDKRIQLAFELALQRRASAEELAVLLELLGEQRQFYRQSPSEAARLISIGIAPSPEPVRAPEIAAWTVLARTILNLHEFLNRS